MELGLSLGDSSSSKTFLDAAQKNSSKPPDLGFHMGLTLHSKSTSDGDDEDDYVDIDDRSSQENVKDKSSALHLLSLAPLRFANQSDNGSSEGGSSGNVRVARGFDVNRMVAAEEATSSFCMDLAKYRGGNKRSLEDGRNDGVEGERGSNSRASDDDENGLARKKLRLSKEQSAFLEESFKEHNTLNPKQKHGLAKQLNLRPRQVEVWFQNRRARTKLKQTEVDCEYLKKCCETLTEENRKLHKELQELRALKSSTPFYMQSPATTLTMCPSCERVATATPPSTTAAKTAGTTSTSTPSPFPLSRSKFFPFSHTPTKAS
ncbi:homeobox-leucine zipper protein HOX11 isoform X2 [Daucus carota subsp. sativus]|uniref:Homeobox domain-containing protein n=1 Tax=Daucus carota subsp. sativus TaxID=79200 RepID=A0A165A582_DAUCS|nr:PREDICTED: homeobox-leucine zipper protein HOX11-like isoform X2 [Daucus carota subsp. sativus]